MASIKNAAGKLGLEEFRNLFWKIAKFFGTVHLSLPKL